MIDNTSDRTLLIWARIAGLAYVLIMVFAMLGMILVSSKLIVRGNDALTVSNISANQLLFRAGILYDIIMFALVVLLSLSLYIILKNVNKNLALIALFFRFGEGIIGGAVTLLAGLVPLLVINNKAALKPALVQALVRAFLDVRIGGLQIVIIFMGIGGIIFFYLFFQSKCVPRILAVWGILTYLSLLLLSLTNLLFPALPKTVAYIFYLPGGLFEVIFGLWLLVNGVNLTALPQQ